MYHYEAELALRSYMPKTLELGMLFANVTEEGTTLWELDKIPQDIESFMVEHGAPMEVYIIDNDDSVIAEPHEIGWFDEGDDTDELRDITLDDINYILNEFDGWIEIEIIEDFFDEDEQVIPNMYEQKVVVRLLTEEETEEE
jgi:hypothetical protein